MKTRVWSPSVRRPRAFLFEWLCGTVLSVLRVLLIKMALSREPHVSRPKVQGTNLVHRRGIAWRWHSHRHGKPAELFFCVWPGSWLQNRNPHPFFLRNGSADPNAHQHPSDQACRECDLQLPCGHGRHKEKTTRASPLSTSPPIAGSAPVIGYIPAMPRSVRVLKVNAHRL